MGDTETTRIIWTKLATCRGMFVEYIRKNDPVQDKTFREHD